MGQKKYIRMEVRRDESNLHDRVRENVILCVGRFDMVFISNFC